MRTERLTVLMKPEDKRALEARAAERGVSSGEYVRLAVDRYAEVDPDEEAQLAALVAEANKVIPLMSDKLDDMSRTLQETHEEIDRMLRQMGAR